MAQKKLPHGRSETTRWPGGTARVLVTGEFMRDARVSTALELHVHEPAWPNGHRPPGRILKTFVEPGEYLVNMPPGDYWFYTYGPEEQPWKVLVQVSLAPPAPKAPSLEQRMAAIERTSASQPTPAVTPNTLN